MAKKASYLKLLPKNAQKIGSAAKGEIEIVTSRREMKKIDAQCADELSGSALGRNGKRVGILLEDNVHLIVRDPLRFPSGARKCQMRVIGKTEFDGVNGVVVLSHLDGRFVLREIFRHPTRRKELETTRGRRESGQTARQAARAEVRQELGYSVKKLDRLGRIHPETAFLSSSVELFFAELAPERHEDDADSGEAFGRIVFLTPDDLASRIASGKIRDSLTICAVMLAQLKGFLSPLRAKS
jgi:8-oxo-dGTP pyrophosphatase MutT (NUDIX family)